MNPNKANNPQPNLFWDRGDFRVSIDFGHNSWDNIRKKGANSILEEFRQVCQRHYFAYCYATLGLLDEFERHKKMFAHAHNKNVMWIGTDDPNDPKQLLGSSTIGQIPQIELLKCLQQGGEFENIVTRAFIVFVYHLWDDAYRVEIANKLSINKNRVKCPLMGDLRRIRNLIIHEGSIVPAGFSSKLEFLPGIWNLLPGNLTISQDMTHSLMEQLNAIHLTISSTELPPR